MRLIRICAVSIVATLLAICVGLLPRPQIVFGEDNTETQWAQSQQQSPEAEEKDNAASLGTRIKTALRRLSDRFEVNPEVIKLYAKWMIGAPALVLFILILMLLRPRRKLAQIESKTSSTPTTEIKPSPVLRRIKFATKADKPKPAGIQPATDTGQILLFFLRLFKRQEKLEADAEAETELIEHRNYCPHDTYEMRVAFKKNWVSRRMSIGLLGQGGGSRSQCFYVIYDSHLVIKIPAVTINDFDDYNRQIAAEARIVSRLAPRLCIVPRIAVIMSAIYAFDDAIGAPPKSEEEQEALYIRMLEEKPAYQEYLKIGGSFAFFMDLAKYFFLSTTLEEIHHESLNLIDEVEAYPDLLWDHAGFIGRYGEETGAVCHDLQDAFHECSIQLRQLIGETAGDEKVPSYMFKQWFLSHLVGEEIHDVDIELPHNVIINANKIISVVLQSCREQVQTYRIGLIAYKRSVRFSRHRRHIENLASNTLDLLAWIIEKGLALRDLKPENLFVAGNPDDYPLFLNDRSKFTIGLIDVETAVELDENTSGDIPQPQLAGTPLYATPAHLLSNAVLKEIYNDVPTTLQMQDWHATLAIIFKLFTGKNLFTITAHVFPEIVSRIKIMDPAGPDMEDDVIQINRLYWNSALAEFQDNMHDHKAIFSQVEVVVPALLAPEIQYIIALDVEQTEALMGDMIAEQSFFNSEDKISFLKSASEEKIGQMKMRLVQERDSGGIHHHHRGEALIFFKHLERLKKEMRRKHAAMLALSSTSPAISADLLLEAMFQRVYQHMYPTHWPALTPSKYRVASYLDTDITTYQATL